MSDNKFINDKDKSEDYYEKSIVYLSAGVLSVSLIFIEKIIPINNTINILYLIFGWILLGLSLLVNLISHRVSVYHTKCSQYETEHLELGYEISMINYRRRLQIMNYINYSNIGLLIFGIFFIIFFAGSNIINKNKMNNNKEFNKAITELVESGRKHIKEGKDPQLPTKPQLNEEFKDCININISKTSFSSIENFYNESIKNSETKSLTENLADSLKNNKIKSLKESINDTLQKSKVNKSDEYKKGYNKKINYDPKIGRNE